MKQISFRTTLMALTILFGLAACKKDPVETPVEIPPQQQLPNPLPATALVKQVKWAENDHETYTYNARGQVSQRRFQYQYVQGDPTKIRTTVDDFQYDAQDRPVLVNSTGGYTVRYFYHGNLIHTTKEFYPGGALAREVTYIYANNRIAQEIWRVSNLPNEPVSVYKHAFSYDSKGNLNKIETYEQLENLQYKLLETLEYSDFDDKINPTAWTLRHPFLPQVRLQFNNPGKEVRQQAEGQPETTIYAYEYNAQGLPVSKRTTRPSGGVLTAQYQY